MQKAGQSEESAFFDFLLIPLTRDIYDLFYVVRFFDAAILGDYDGEDDREE